ncbi:hypothetical protein V496_10480 [Pseudogymnoascus sp. VKM F-4515 (FW-2607)]|nr:hypothetical protein V496_10480 [Pseudogymnoascus sp. VKM F-4515 (FW-2607)]
MEGNKPITFDLNGDAKYHLIAIPSRYSGWCARVAIVMEHFQLPYICSTIKVCDVKKMSNSGLVPVLIPLSPKLDIQIYDSLAICEFLAESHPTLPLWPKDPVLRALARSATAEMHSGFSELRTNYHSSFVARYTGNVPVTEKARQEAERALSLWLEARTKTAQRLKELGEEDEGYLFGKFGIADAFYWPILWRFRTYSLPLTTASPEALLWAKKMWSDPTLKLLGKDYFKQAEDPETAIIRYDDVFKGNPEILFGRFEEDWEFTVG